MSGDAAARPTVAWVVPGGAAAPAAADAQSLRAAGWDVTVGAADPGDPVARCELRVLDGRTAGPAKALRDAYLADARPTLVLVASAADEVTLMACLRPSDDLVRDAGALAAVAQRLARLRGRAKDTADLALLRAHVDPLTRLPDRTRYLRGFEDHTEAFPADHCVGLLLLDLDNFNTVNRTLGRANGDCVLAEIAERLRRHAQPLDQLFRLELEEFVVLIVRAERADVIADAESFRRTIGDIAFAAGDGALHVTASAGLAFLDEGPWRYGAIHRAHQAMYMAKIVGRDRLVLHEDVQLLADRHGTSLDLEDMFKEAEAAKTRLVSMAGEVNQRLLAEAQREANQDALTRIHNRRYFDSRIAREMDLSRRHGQPLTVALIDIDDFRLVNNTYGHPAGDLVLRGFAALATRSIRGVDWVARYGGEEFCLVMPATLPEGLRVAERIRENAAQARTTVIDGRTIAYTVTIGVVEFDPDRDTDPVQLLHRASKAERGAKDAGKNRVAGG